MQLVLLSVQRHVHHIFNLMCYHPIRLRTNKKSFNPKTDKLYNTFPCGKCGECRTNKQESWEIRSYYEWKRCTNSNGITLFVTQTYDEDSLPYILLNDVFIPVFSKTHIRSFYDSLRFQLDRYFGTTFNFRYFTTCEFGGLTHRPHYHSEFFFDNFDIRLLNKLKHIIRMCWKYGFVSYGNINGGVIQDVRGLKYVAKYVSKDLDFYDEDIDDYLFNLKLTDKERYKTIKNEICPFHLQSKYFGLSALEEIDIHIAERGLIKVPNQKSGTFDLKKLPLYFERHLFYELDQYNSYKLTEYGCKVRQDRYDELTVNLTDHITNTVHNVEKYINEESLVYINNVLGTQFNCAEAIKNRFMIFFMQHTVDSLVDYVQNKRDTVFVDDAQLFDEVQTMSYKQRYNYNLRCFPNSDLDPLYYPDFLRLESRLFNGLHEYLECEFIYSLFTAVRCAIGKQENLNKFKQFQTYSKLKKHGYK